MRKAPVFQAGDKSAYRIYPVVSDFNRCFSTVKINSFTTAVCDCPEASQYCSNISWCLSGKSTVIVLAITVYT
jgi:hypothetical protein